MVCGVLAERGSDVNPSVEIVIPVHNEEKVLAQNIGRLHDFLSDGFPYPWYITIVNNASSDGTATLASLLTHQLNTVYVRNLRQKGRGRALRLGWTEAGADVVAYMDVDLSADLNALLPLVAPIISGHSEVSIGTRHHRNADVTRSFKRRVISLYYNLLLQWTLRVGFSDAMCGFKAMRADVARELLPLVKDNEWFFDAELLIQAERHGMRIHEVPLDWVDDPNSSVDIWPTAKKAIAGMWRMRRVREASPPHSPTFPTPAPRRDLRVANDA